MSSQSFTVDHHLGLLRVLEYYSSSKLLK